MKKMSKVALLLAMILALALSSIGCAPAASNAGATSAAGEPKNRLEAIIARGYIEVATEPAFAPYEFIDPTKSGDDKYVGSDIEFAKYIAEKLGVECRIVPLEFSAVQIGVAEGKYDLAISALAWKPDRVEAMILSKGYFFNKASQGHGLLIRKEDIENYHGPDDLKGKTVVCQSGSLQEYLVETQMSDLKETKRVSATPDGFLMVQEKKADACATAKSTAQLYLDANPDCGMILVEDFTFHIDETTDGTRVGITLGETELEAKINEIIDEVLASGIYEEWHTQYADYARSLGI